MRAVDAAGKIGYSQSWLSRVEAGVIKVHPEQVRDMLRAYRLPTDDLRAQRLMTFARGMDEPYWWERLDVPAQFATYLGFEAEARAAQTLEVTLIPGLLQTQEYARAVLSTGWGTEGDAVPQRLKARMTRQTALYRRPSPLVLHALIAAPALGCQVGGGAVMAAQRKRLLATGELANVTIQIIPYSAGEHLASLTAFTMLTFRRGQPMLGYLETSTGNLLLEPSQELTRLEMIWKDLVMRALSPEESMQFIRESE